MGRRGGEVVGSQAASGSRGRERRKAGDGAGGEKFGMKEKEGKGKEGTGHVDV